MDSLRKSQIDEYMNEHDHFNRMVMKLDRQNAQNFNENLLPSQTLDTETIDGVGSAVGNLLMLLDRKQAMIHNLTSNIFNLNANGRNKYIEIFNDVTQLEEVVRLYKQAVKPYFEISNSTAQYTKSELSTTLRKLATPLNQITSSIETLMVSLSASLHADNIRK